MLDEGKKPEEPRDSKDEVAKEIGEAVPDDSKIELIFDEAPTVEAVGGDACEFEPATMEAVVFERAEPEELK